MLQISFTRENIVGSQFVLFRQVYRLREETDPSFTKHGIRFYIDRFDKYNREWSFYCHIPNISQRGLHYEFPLFGKNIRGLLQYEDMALVIPEIKID